MTGTSSAFTKDNDKIRGVTSYAVFYNEMDTLLICYAPLEGQEEVDAVTHLGLTEEEDGERYLILHTAGKDMLALGDLGEQFEQLLAEHGKADIVCITDEKQRLTYEVPAGKAGDEPPKTVEDSTEIGQYVADYMAFGAHSIVKRGMDL